MTDENQGQEPESGLSRPPGMPEEDHDDAAALEGAGDFTSGEGLVAFAGIVVFMVWLIFDFIVDTYPMNNIIALVSVTAAILPRMRRETVEKVHPLPVLMKIAGYGLFGLGAIEVLLDLRFGVLDHVGAIIGGLASYAGYAMAFIGARQIDA